MNFEFATANRILFGAGTVREIPRIASSYGERAIVVSGQNPKRADDIAAGLAASSIAFTVYRVTNEPTVDAAVGGARTAVGFDAQFVVAIGGGSVIDAGKAIAALMTNVDDPYEYLEVVGKGRPLTQTPAPCIAVPTTAGTGSEVTCNAVLASPGHRVKVSLRHPSMLPDVAVIDPEMTCSMPPALTAATGLDALTQVSEPFVSPLANPLTDAVCREGIRRASKSLRRVWENGDDMEAREDMALVSLFGGLALANAKLGAVHGIAGPFGGMFPAPHGAVCARLLPAVTDVNVRALRTRATNSHALARYDEIGSLLTGRAGATADDAVTWIHELCGTLRVPSLSSYGCRESDFPLLIEKSRRSSSMKGNPIELTDDELTEILETTV